MTQLLALGLRKMRQPKVIAEVLGGILLGPTAFGRIPGFTQHIFPQESRPYLSLVANIGLCLFLFLVGLEIDSGIIKRNAKLSAIVALAGMILPFGFGAALAVPLYNKFIPKDVEFTHFMLFTGVAYSITAFPVLCRILTELKLLDTTVGIVVLSAGVGNDIIGWTLLALSVALVNAGSGLTALYILLTCVAWTVFLLFPAKFALRWIARKTGSIENGPTMFFMTVTILLLFGSAFFTDIIGVHAIFGAFVVGIIVPREGGLAIALTEKLEDMVSILFLPLYFTLSGLSTDLGLLNDGITWGYTVAICVLAFVGKFGGCTLASKYMAGFNWRESSAIGSLMSCKGLVELIVLNVGLTANILTPQVFSMFVLEALLLTFITTPLVTKLYPPHLRVRATASGSPFAFVGDEEAARRERRSRADELTKSRFTVVLDKIDHVPGMMSLVQLLQPARPQITRSRPSSVSDDDNAPAKSPASPLPGSQSIFVNALRLIELSDRVSAVMKSSAHDALLKSDPVLAIFRMFGQLNNIVTSGTLAIVPFDDLAYNVAEQAQRDDADMIILPWLPPHTDVDGYGAPLAEPVTPSAKPSTNPFDAMFKTGSGSHAEKSASVIHSQFVRGVFSQAKTDVALFIDQVGPEPSPISAAGTRHVFLPFFGGPDDRLALDFVVQLCASEHVTATVVRIIKSEEGHPAMPVQQPKTDKEAEEANAMTVASGIVGFPDTVYGQATTETRLQSETADNIAWARYASPAANEPHDPALTRIEFTEAPAGEPLHAAIRQAEASGLDARGRPRELLVLTGRSRRLAVENHANELKGLMEEHGNVGPEVKRTIGDVATAFIVVGCGSAVVVVQAANIPLD
ncbi:hypothetical protein HGRIS_006464 [Hohenbuehelia grisea]